METSYFKGTVILKGEVASAAAATLAEEIALKINGVSRVRNQLVVNPQLQPQSEIRAMPKFIDDQTIASQLSQAIVAENIFNGGIPEITVSNGHVTLAGDANDFRQIDKALSVALMIEGVTAVSNQMTINGAAYISR